jgi:hypothetical protein
MSVAVSAVVRTKFAVTVVVLEPFPFASVQGLPVNPVAQVLPLGAPDTVHEENKRPVPGVAVT